MSHRQEIVTFTHEKPKTLDILVEMSIVCLQHGTFSTSIYYTSLYIIYRVPVIFIGLADA